MDKSHFKGRGMETNHCDLQRLQCAGRAIRQAFLILTCLCAEAPGSMAQENPQSIMMHHVKALAAIDEYVRTTRGWPKNSYSIEFQRRDGDILDFWVIHSDDKVENPIAVGGGGKSFAVDLYSSSLRIIRELHFQ